MNKLLFVFVACLLLFTFVTAEEKNLEGAQSLEKTLFFRRIVRKASSAVKKVGKAAKKHVKKHIKKVAKFSKAAFKAAKNPVRFVKNEINSVKTKIKHAKILVKLLNDLKKSHSTAKFNGKKVQCWKMYGNYCGGGYCGNKWWDGCRGNNVAGEKCSAAPFTGQRPKPIDEVDACCMKHDDCCSNVRVSSEAGKKVPCNCNKEMGKCFAKAKKTCTNDECKVAGAVMEKLSSPFKVVQCSESCFKLKLGFTKTFQQIGSSMMKGFKKGLKGIKVAFGGIKSIFKKKRSSSKKVAKNSPTTAAAEKKSEKKAFRKLGSKIKKGLGFIKKAKFGFFRKLKLGTGKIVKSVKQSFRKGFSFFKRIKFGKGLRKVSKRKSSSKATSKRTFRKKKGNFKKNIVWK